MKSVGVIGYGHFGAFLVEKLMPHFEIKVYSSSGKSTKWSTTLQDVASCDFVVLSLPLAKYADVCNQLKPHLSGQTTIVDVCSVKEESGEIIRRHLPGQPLLSTHPLFGPESAKDSLSGHTIVLCPDMTTESLLQPSREFFEHLGLKTVEMDSIEHDRSMALVQGLTFFVARVLKDYNLHDSKLVTPSFRKLMALADLEKHHTPELFITIQKGNPHAEEVREHFIRRSKELHTLLSVEEIPE